MENNWFDTICSLKKTPGFTFTYYLLSTCKWLSYLLCCFPITGAQIVYYSLTLSSLNFTEVDVIFVISSIFSRKIIMAPQITSASFIFALDEIHLAQLVWKHLHYLSTLWLLMFDLESLFAAGVNREAAWLQVTCINGQSSTAVSCLTSSKGRSICCGPKGFSRAETPVAVRKSLYTGISFYVFNVFFFKK